MFEHLRQALRDALRSAPADRREAVARMRDTVVQARVGLSDLRDGVAETRRRLEAERRELETVRRRKRLAADISDAETVTIAERYERQHAERVVVLERKLAAQEEEVAVAEREIAEMTAELRAAASAAPRPADAHAVAADDPLRDTLGEELDAMARARRREATDVEAARKLEELKRRMGR
jgi:hypothetical protein